MTDSAELSDDYKALIAKAAEHAWERHGSEEPYRAIGITSKESLAAHMERIAVSQNTEFFEGSNNRLIFSDKTTGTRMILNINGPGTCMIAPHQNASFDVQYAGEFDKALNDRGEQIADFSPVHTVGHRGLPEITKSGFDFSRIRSGVDLHASRALGAAAIAVDLAQGNEVGAAENAAVMAAQTKTAEEAAAQAAARVGLTGTFNHLMRAMPVVGSVLAYRAMTEEVARFEQAGRPDLAEAAYQVGKAEVLGNIAGGWSAEAAREAAREAYIKAGGSDYEQIAHSGTMQLAIAAKGMVLGSKETQASEAPIGRHLPEVLPATHSSMAQGADEMGDRGEIKRIAVERTGLAADDPRNDIQTLLNDNKWRPMGHLLILADGTVQGPEQGAIPFENNPRLAAGKNGETFGVMYAGQGAMNAAQARTLAQVADHLMQLRWQDGLPKDMEIIAGSTSTAELMNLPTPRGPLPEVTAPQSGMDPAKPRQITIGSGGMAH